MEFTVGDKPVKHFRMIERHYFKNRLLKLFDFDFGFCMPNTKNTCEHIYEMPELNEDEGNKSDDLYRVIVTTPYQFNISLSPLLTTQSET